MPFEKKIENVFGTVLNQIEKMEKKIIDKDEMKEVSQTELQELGFTDDDINFLVFKKRLLIKNTNNLGSKHIHDIIYEMPADYYYQKVLYNQKVKQLDRLKDLENLE